MNTKVIHYCWFGKKPLPKLALKCIKSWKKYLPDYEIKQWNEANFDINIIPYTQEAYKAKKYAFVSDYARFWILYNYGGLYFDTDVEVIKPMNDIIAKGPFMGCENDVEEDLSVSVAPGLGLGVNPGLGLGVNPGLGLYKEILETYSTLHFIQSDGTLNQKTVVSYTTEILNKYGLKAINDLQYCAGVWIYPKEYFCPISTSDGKLRLTNNTVSIHHYSQSWQSPIRKYGRKIVLFLGGEKLKRFLKNILRLK